MGCCKCEIKHVGWDDPQLVVYADPADQQEYCVFHAPKDEKRKALDSEERYTVKEFNAQVFARIDEVIKQVKAGKTDAKCNLSDTVFPGEVVFGQYGKDNPLPAISFHGATFSGEAWFAGVRFSGEVRFGWATFGGRAEFRWAKTEKDCRFELESMQPGSLKHLTFTRAELEAPLFRFVNCIWPDRLGLEVHGEGNTDNLLECEYLYRAMKKGATDEHDQRMVSVWHYREKLMALLRIRGFGPVLAARQLWRMMRDRNDRTWRKLCEKGLPLLARAVLLPLSALRALFSVTFWYWLSSGFGERMGRAGAALALLAVLPFLAFGPAGAALLPKFQAATNATAAPGLVEGFFSATNATAAMQFIPFTKDIGGEGWAKVVRGVWHVLIIIQGTLFALAVRNRFRR